MPILIHLPIPLTTNTRLRIISPSYFRLFRDMAQLTLYVLLLYHLLKWAVGMTLLHYQGAGVFGYNSIEHIAGLVGVGIPVGYVVLGRVCALMESNVVLQWWVEGSRA